MKMRPMYVLAATLGFLLPGFALSQDMMAMDEDPPVESFVGYQLEGYNYDEHFCWVLEDTAYADEEGMATAMGNMETPVYTFELDSMYNIDMCLWNADENWAERNSDTWKYRNCDFHVESIDSSWNDLIAGVNGYNWPEMDGSHNLVYEGHIAELMICVDDTHYSGSHEAEILLFEGDTSATDDIDTMMEDEQ